MTNMIKIICNNITGTSGLNLLNAEFGYSWNNLINSDPIESSFTNSEVTFNGWQNPTINLVFHLPINNSALVNGTTFMSWAKWNSIAKNVYNKTDANSACKLQIVVSSTNFTDYSYDNTGVTSIPFVVKNYNLKFSPGDSHNSSFWTINAVLQVTQ